VLDDLIAWRDCSQKEKKRICPEQEAFAPFVQNIDFVMFSLFPFFWQDVRERSICFSFSSPHGLAQKTFHNINNLKVRRGRAQRLL